MAVQFAKCCRPIPGDPIVGFIKKDQGLVIHTHDCPAISKTGVIRTTGWTSPGVKILPGSSRSASELMVANQRGVLARVAAAIAEAGSNIDNVAMEGDGYVYDHEFHVAGRNRHHLAQVMRSLRRIPEVAKISPCEELTIADIVFLQNTRARSEMPGLIAQFTSTIAIVHMPGPAPAIFPFPPASSLCALHNLPPDPCRSCPPQNNRLQGEKNRSPIPPR